MILSQEITGVKIYILLDRCFSSSQPFFGRPLLWLLQRVGLWQGCSLMLGLLSRVLLVTSAIMSPIWVDGLHVMVENPWCWELPCHDADHGRDRLCAIRLWLGPGALAHWGLSGLFPIVQPWLPVKFPRTNPPCPRDLVDRCRNPDGLLWLGDSLLKNLECAMSFSGRLLAFGFLLTLVLRKTMSLFQKKNKIQLGVAQVHSAKDILWAPIQHDHPKWRPIYFPILPLYVRALGQRDNLIFVSGDDVGHGSL